MSLHARDLLKSDYRLCRPFTESTLRKHAYSNIFSPPKNEKFMIKNSDIFRGGSNEYPQSMFLSRNKKINVYPCKPQFYYIKMGFKGVKIIKKCLRDDNYSTVYQ